MQQIWLDADFINRFRSSNLTEAEAKSFVVQPHEVVVFTLLALAEGESKAHLPRSTNPLFQKPASEKKLHGKPGAKQGQVGASRARPERIDLRTPHQLPCCPECEGMLLVRRGETRTRITEDMPVDMQAEATEHTIHSDWCPRCKKRVEPQLPDQLTRCTLGNRLLPFLWHYYVPAGNNFAECVIRTCDSPGFSETGGSVSAIRAVAIRIPRRHRGS